MFWAILMAMVMGTGLASCSSDSDDNGGTAASEEQVMGLWETVPTEMYIVYAGQRFNASADDVDMSRIQFGEDHSYRTYYLSGNSWTEDISDRGRWTLSGSQLTITFDGSGNSKTGTIKEISATRMVFRHIMSDYDEDSGKEISYEAYWVLKRVN